MKVMKLGTAVMLLFAILPLPQGYYTLLRLIVSISSGISAFHYLENKKTGLALVFGLILLLFNPIFPIYLDKGTWIIIDIIIGLFFGISGFNEKDENQIDLTSLNSDLINYLISFIPVNSDDDLIFSPKPSII